MEHRGGNLIDNSFACKGSDIKGNLSNFCRWFSSMKFARQEDSLEQKAAPLDVTVQEV
jgi:hypothetical protein